MDSISPTSVISITPTEFGNVANRPTNISMYEDWGIKTSAFLNAIAGDTFESAPIVVKEPGNYSIFMYRALFSGGGKATISIQTKYSLDGSTININYGLIDFYKGSTDAQVLAFRNITIPVPCTLVVKYVITTNRIQTGDIVLVKNS